MSYFDAVEIAINVLKEMRKKATCKKCYTKIIKELNRELDSLEG